MRIPCPLDVLGRFIGLCRLGQTIPIANVLVTSASSIFLSEAESISFWSGNVAAAEAKRRKVLASTRSSLQVLPCELAMRLASIVRPIVEH